MNKRILLGRGTFLPNFGDLRPVDSRALRWIGLSEGDAVNRPQAHWNERKLKSEFDVSNELEVSDEMDTPEAYFAVSNALGDRLPPSVPRQKLSPFWRLRPLDLTI